MLNSATSNYKAGDVSLFTNLVASTDNTELLFSIIEHFNDSFVITDLIAITDAICDQLGILYTGMLSDIFHSDLEADFSKSLQICVFRYFLDLLTRLPQSYESKMNESSEWIQVSDRRFPLLFTQVFEEVLKQNHTCEPVLFQPTVKPISFIKSFWIKSREDFDFSLFLFKTVKATDTLCCTLFDWLLIEDENVVSFWTTQILPLLPISRSHLFRLFVHWMLHLDLAHKLYASDDVSIETLTKSFPLLSNVRKLMETIEFDLQVMMQFLDDSSSSAFPLLLICMMQQKGEYAELLNLLQNVLIVHAVLVKEPFKISSFNQHESASVELFIARKEIELSHHPMVVELLHSSMAIDDVKLEEQLQQLIECGEISILTKIDSFLVDFKKTRVQLSNFIECHKIFSDRPE